MPQAKDNTDRPLRVVQITDTHLYADPDGRLLRLNTRQSMEMTLAHLIDHHWPADLILATGDLVHDGSDTGYRFFQQRMAAFDAPVYCIAGNHDEGQVLRRHMNGGPTHSVGSARHGDWAFVFLDSNLPNSPGGYLKDSEFPHLIESLERYRDQHVLVVLHHQPVPVGSSWLDTMAVSNADALLSVLGESPQVKGVLWGHVHQEHDSLRNGMRMLSCPSTCIQFLPGSITFAIDTLTPGYRWLNLYPDGRIETAVERIAGYPEDIDLTSAGY